MSVDMGKPTGKAPPLAQAEARILRCLAPNKWKLVLGEIKTAFWSGDEEHGTLQMTSEIP